MRLPWAIMQSHASPECPTIVRSTPHRSAKWPAAPAVFRRNACRLWGKARSHHRATVALLRARPGCRPPGSLDAPDRRRSAPRHRRYRSVPRYRSGRMGIPARVTGASIRSRVVPAMSVTIATSRSASRLASVDFPLFGGPARTMRTPSRRRSTGGSDRTTAIDSASADMPSSTSSRSESSISSSSAKSSSASIRAASRAVSSIH